MQHSSLHVFACMTSSFFHKATAQLAHLLHARLSPFRFLLRLYLLPILLRIATSPSFLSFLSRTSASIRDFYLQLHPYPTASLLLAAIPAELRLILLANCIIVMLYVSSKRGSTTSSDQGVIYGPFMDHTYDDDEANGDGGDDKDARKQYDIVADAPQLSAKASAVSNYTLALASAPAAQANDSYDAYNLPSNYDLPISTAPSMALPNTISISPLAVVATSKESLSNDLGLMHIYSSQFESGKQMSNTIENCECNSPEKPSNSTSPKPRNQVAATAPTISTIPSPRHKHSSQRSLGRHESDGKTSSNEDARDKPRYGRHPEDSSQKSLIRHKSDRQMRSSQEKVKCVERTISCSYYYEYAKEGDCSTSTLYTGSIIDGMSHEDANRHFSEFASRKWAKIRNERQLDCDARPPPAALLCNSPYRNTRR